MKCVKVAEISVNFPNSIGFELLIIELFVIVL